MSTAQDVEGSVERLTGSKRRGWGEAHTYRHGALPLQPAPLIGRERELDVVRRMVLEEGARLVNLTGPAGTGKTRLAVEAAASVAGAFRHGTCFVDLAPVQDPGLVISAIAEALDVRDAGDQPLAESVRRFLRERRALLVLDNFEQVLDAAPEVAALLAARPDLAVLVTSRAALHLRWERELAVPPLAVPDLTHLPGAAALARVPAVALFVERARAIQRDFALDGPNGRAVAEVCVRLDGLPLAIELAAARVRSLSASQIAARLERRLFLLVGGARDQPTRHQTLRAAIAWSYDLLAPEEQALFRRLGVFVGGFVLEAAEAVAGGQGSHVEAAHLDHMAQGLDSGPGDVHVAAVLESLVAGSLVRVEAAPGGGARFGLLETIREYALERLVTGGEAAAVERRHAAFYLALGAQAEAKLKSAAQLAWLARLEAEHENLRQVLARSLGAGGDAGVALELAGALAWFWWMRGHAGEGRRWLEAALAAGPDAPAATRARALHGAGLLANAQGDHQGAIAHHETGLSLYRALGDRWGTAWSLGNLALEVDADSGGYPRRAALVEEALARFRALGDPWHTAWALATLGHTLLSLGNAERAAAMYEESLVLYRRVGDAWAASRVLHGLAILARIQGDYARARLLLDQSDAALRPLGDARGLSTIRRSQGMLEQLDGDLDRAATYFRQSLALAQQVGHQGLIASILFRLGRIARQQGDHGRAVRLLGAARAVLDAAGLEVASLLGGDPTADAAELAAVAGDLEYAAASGAGGAISLDEAIAFALASAGGEVGRGAASAGAPGGPRDAAPAEAAWRAGSVQPPPSDDLPEPLSARETEVLRLLAAGLTNPEVAVQMMVTLATVKTHVQHVFEKLGVNDRRAAARAARELRLI